jgi:hypothetical protein
MAGHLRSRQNKSVAHAEITRIRIRRGSFKSVSVQTIEDYIRTNNKNPKPFVWTKKPAAILKKIARRKAATVTLHENND